MRVFQKYRKATAFLLMFLFLWTPFLTFLTTPLFSQIDSYRWVVICTYNGLKTVPLNDQGEIADVTEDVCPVLQLFANLAQAFAPDADIILPVVLTAASLTIWILCRIEPAVFRLVPPVRAPPRSCSFV